jgi:hypothetical protein
MKQTLMRVPKGKVFIPYRDREAYPEDALRDEERIVLGKGFDERTIGWLIASEAYSRGARTMNGAALPT